MAPSWLPVSNPVIWREHAVRRCITEKLTGETKKKYSYMRVRWIKTSFGPLAFHPRFLGDHKNISRLVGYAVMQVCRC